MRTAKSQGAILLHVAEDKNEITQLNTVVASIHAEIEKASPSRRQRIYEAIALAALSSIPWIGGVFAAGMTYKIREDDVARDSLVEQWLREHQEKLLLLRQTLEEMVARLESLGEEIDERVQSKEYLALLRKAFRQWDEADTHEKRRLVVNLITNAGGTRICSDDILRLFLDWIDNYHESHFAVIRVIYQQRNDPPTRYDIWVAVYGEPVPRDDSADADLYRMLISDLSIGRVIRQPRDTDWQGRFKRRPRGRRTSAATLELAFEDTKQYVLTELGSQFVHYTMNELVARLAPSGDGEAGASGTPGAV